MKAVVQVVSRASLKVDEKTISQIEKGLVVYLGIKEFDTKEQASKLAQKIANLRVFKDENEKLNKSTKDIDGSILAVSNFTLYGDASHGNRPNFMFAMKSKDAEEIYEHFISELKSHHSKIQQGIFGADMEIEQTLIGPVNIIIEM